MKVSVIGLVALVGLMAFAAGLSLGKSMRPVQVEIADPCRYDLVTMAPDLILKMDRVSGMLWMLDEKGGKWLDLGPSYSPSRGGNRR